MTIKLASTQSIEKYRLEQWEKSEKYYNFPIDDDDEYPSMNDTERDYRYDCSIENCRSRWDLRMTPSGLFCAEHYLPWLHRNGAGNRLPMNCCSHPGCGEPRLSDKINTCRDHYLTKLPDIVIMQMAEILALMENEKTHY